jgi:hypothetical protein
MQFCIIYHNLENGNVCARFAHLRFKLRFSCEVNCHTTTLEPITKHLVAQDINRLHLLMHELKIMKTLGSLMDE